MSRHEMASEQDGSVDRLIRLSRAGKDQHVSVAGPGGLEAMAHLCRQGYAHVQCARSAICGAGEADSDVLILTGPLSSTTLLDEIRRHLRLLRHGGTLAIQLARLDDDCDVQALLALAGIEVDFTVFDLSHEVLVAHVVLAPRAASAPVRRAA